MSYWSSQCLVGCYDGCVFRLSVRAPLHDDDADGYDGEEGGGDGSHANGKQKPKPDRIGWTKEEDAIITSSVAQLGHKWYQISERLPGRTDHAIRNRWHRLLTMRQDASRVSGTSYE